MTEKELDIIHSEFEELERLAYNIACNSKYKDEGYVDEVDLMIFQLERFSCSFDELMSEAYERSMDNE